MSAPGVAITSSLPAGPGRAVGRARRDEHGEPARRRRRRAAEAAPPRLDGGRRSSRRSCRRPTRSRDRSGREISVLREGGGLINLVRADNPLLFAAPTSITFPVNGGTRDGRADRRGRRRRRAGPSRRSSRARAPGVDGHGPADRHRARRARRHGDGRDRGRVGRRHRLRRAHARHRHAPDPVLGRGRPSACSAREPTTHADGARPVQRARRVGGDAQGQPLPLSDQRRRRLPGP